VPKFRNFYASRHPLQSVDLFSKGFSAQLRKCIEVLGQAIALARCFRKVLKQIENVDPSKLFEVLYDAQDKAREAYFKAQQKLSSISSGLGSYASAAESRKFFNDKLSTGEKRKALMLSLGAVRRGNQYELRRNDIYGIERLAGEYRVLAKAQNDVKIGQITIGTESVQNVFNELVDDVNRTVFEIFEELSSLSTNIQGYFAGGLEDDSKADSAITSAKNIGKKTEQTKDIK